MKNVDDFFKDKFENREFEFQEAYWDDAKKLIDGDEKRRRRGGWLPWFLGLAMVTLLSVGIYWLVAKSKTSQNSGAHAESGVIVSENQETNANTKGNSDHASATISETEKNKAAAENNTKSISSDITTTDSSTPQSTGTLNTTERSGQTSDTRTKKGFSPNENITNTVLQNLTTLTTEPATTSEGENPIATASNAEEQKAEDLIPRILMNPFDQLPLKTFERISMPMTYWTIDCSTIPNEQDKKWNWSWNIYTLLNSQKGGDYFWLGAATGPGIQYRLNKRLSVQSDLLYRWRRGHFSPKEESTATTYSFGRTTETFRLNATEIHQLDLPVYLQFRNRRQMLEGGISLQWNLGLRGDLISEKSLFPWERKETENAPANPTATNVVESGWINDVNIRKVQFGLLLGYRYQLNDKINAGLQVRYDLNSIYKEIPLDGVGKLDGSPLHFQVGFSYYPFN